MGMRLPKWVWIALALALVVAAGEAAAQAYTWQDEKGRRHYTDNLAAVPAQFRNQIEERAMDPIVRRDRERGETGSAGFLDESLDRLFIEIDKDRRTRSMPPLTRQQRQQLESWTQSWVLPWLLGTALSLLVSIGLVIHGFATGHPGWALANFFLWVTQPFYVMLHVGENNVGVRVVVLLLVLAPLAIVTFAARSLFGVIQALAA